MAITPRNLYPTGTTAPKGPRVLNPVTYTKKIRTVGATSTSAVATLPVMTPVVSAGTYWRVWEDAIALDPVDLAAAGITTMPLISGFLWEELVLTTDNTNDYLATVVVAGEVDGQDILDRVFSASGPALDPEIVKAIAAAGNLTLAGLTAALKNIRLANNGFHVVGLIDVR